MRTSNFQYFATGQIPDGYMGNWTTVTFYWNPASGKTMVGHGLHYFSYHTPPATDKNEAMWLLKNHPSSNARFVTQ